MSTSSFRLSLLILLAMSLDVVAAPVSGPVEIGRRATAYVAVEGQGGSAWSGSAFCIDASGLFVTNDHVVTEKGKVAPRIFVIVSPGTPAERRIPATVVRTNAERDVAILKVANPGVLDTVDLAPAVAVSRIRETNTVMALGFPFGEQLSAGRRAPEVTISTGRVTALRVNNRNQIVAMQFDGAINPGNSGGPLLDERGAVIGVVYAIIRDARQTNLAKPVGHVWEMLEEAGLVLTPRILLDPASGEVFASLLAGKPPEGRTPVPDAATQQAAKKIVRDLFAAQFADKAMKSRLLLMGDLLAKAQETKDDPAGRWALLTEARELALQTPDIGTAMYATAQLADGYDVDSLESVTEVVRTLSPRSTKPQDAVVAAAIGMLVIDARARRGEYAEVRKLILGVRTNIVASRNPAALNVVRDRLLRYEADAAESDKAASAMSVLASKPDDAASNLVAGRFYCLIRGDFDKGLPYLNKSGDAALRKIAAAEIALPTTAEKQKELGDLWWDQIAKEAKGSSAYEQCRIRAASWYRLALSNLTGLSRSLIAQRLADLPVPSGMAATVLGSGTSNPGTTAEPGPQPPPAIGGSGGGSGGPTGAIAVGTLESRRKPRVNAIPGSFVFEAPRHDKTWFGANGVALPADKSWEQSGTIWVCGDFRPRPWGITFIHPLGDGHVVVNVSEKEAGYRDDGGWSSKDGFTSLKLAPELNGNFKLDREKQYVVRSEMSADGVYRLLLDGAVVATARMRPGKPLRFGEGFQGDRLPGALPRGYTAVIIDNSFRFRSVAADLAFYPSK